MHMPAIGIVRALGSMLFASIMGRVVGAWS